MIDTTEIGGSVAKKRVASEAVMLYRVILELPIWRITASMRIEQNLCALLRVIEGGRSSSDALVEGIATLDILGGFARMIRPGHIANVWTDNTTDKQRFGEFKTKLGCVVLVIPLVPSRSRTFLQRSIGFCYSTYVFPLLFYVFESDNIKHSGTAEMKHVSSSSVITQSEDEISPSKLMFTSEQLAIFVGLIRDVEEDSVQRHQIRALAIRAVSEQLKVEQNAEAVFGHELQLLLMSASLKCPTYLRQSFTKSSVLMRWNDTENLYLDVKSLEDTIVFSDGFEDEKKKGTKVFQIHGDEADMKILNMLYDECEGKYSREL